MQARAKVWMFSLAIASAAVVALQMTPRDAASPRGPASASTPPHPADAVPMQQHARWPLTFEVNAGQSSPEVRFLSRTLEYTLFLTATEAVYAVHPTSPASNDVAVRDGSRTPVASTDGIVRISLVDANPEPVVEGLSTRDSRSSYFVGNDPSRWRRDIPHYGKVRYRDIYPGIDLEYYGNPRQLEYDFLIRPGTDPSRIIMRIDAAGGAAIDANGDLVIGTGERRLKHRKPLVYQLVDRGRSLVESSYRLLSGNHVGFDIGDYDRTLPLVIDPVVEYSTFLGGSGSDFVSNGGIAVDHDGDVYIVGATRSVDFPQATAHPGTPTPSDTTHQAFVAVLGSDGQTLRRVTYFGGSAGAQADSVALDMAGNVLVSGMTQSDDFPVVAALQSSLAGDSDAFVVKFNAGAGSILHSTYLGGTGADAGWEIRTDVSGGVYVSGTTTSPDFPVTAGAFQTTLAGPVDRYVTKLNQDVSGLVYSTYFGGSGSETGGVLEVDATGHAHIAGSTVSSDLPTHNAFQPELRGVADAFIAKIDPTGSNLVFGSYLGGSDGTFEDARALAVSDSGIILLAGATNSTDFPIVNGLQTQNAGGGADAYLVRLPPFGQMITYSTYLGGSAGDTPQGLAIDGECRVHIAGSTRSGNFPISSDATQASMHGVQDGFVVQLSNDLLGVERPPSMRFGTYLGGSANDSISGIALDRLGNVVALGSTLSPDFPVHAPLQQMIADVDFGDAFLTKMTSRPLSTGEVVSDSCSNNFRRIARNDPASGSVWQSMAQSFVATVPQATFGFRLLDSGASLPNRGASVIYRLYPSDSTQAAPLATRIVTTPGTAASGPRAIHGDLGFVEADFSAVRLVPGRMYTMEITVPASSMPSTGNHHGIGVWTSLSNPYRDGRFFFPSELNNDWLATQDMAFRMAAKRSSIPNDFNGDGRSDLFWHDTTTLANTIWRSANNATPQAVATVTNANWTIAGVGDFDGDRNADILWHNSRTLANVIWRSGNIASLQQVTTVANADWTIAGVGDFDGDGRSDILWRNTRTLANVIWRSANYATQQPVTTIRNADWTIAGVGDFNGDGRSDILWRNARTLANVIWRSANYATQQPVTTIRNAAWTIAGIGDFDGDDRSDILWHNTSTFANVIWKSGDYSNQQPVTTVTSAAWTIAGVSDFDGDGQHDIFWRSTTSGANAIWRSGNYASRRSITSMPPTWRAHF